MDNNEDLQVGEKIEIEIDEKDGVGQYKSRIEEIIDESTIIITMPIGRGKYAYITEGQVLRMVFCRKDSAYYFSTRVLERIKSQESVLIKLGIISERLKLQRRNYFRLGIIVLATVNIAQYGAEDITKVEKKFYTSDISGGGVKIISDQKIEEGTEVEVSLDIPSIEDKIIKGKVRRSIPSFKNKAAYDMGIEFIDIEPRVKQTIIQYIFTKQRELLKRGFK